MKREYAKPLFYAEKYMVASSIASCDYHVGDSDTEPLTIKAGEGMCPVGDSGHEAGKKKANIPVENYPLTLFNDGIEGTECQYDWSGGNVTGPDGVSYGDFGKAFYGATASNDNHRPGYGGRAFFS